ncbi:TetR/AcrR family transcriptional regulator, partial [Peptoniphilus sp. SGI.035]|uniref:TetR/AcrR family transcriptional regulator n=1 Tax=Peptoniphilus sp. SGI.035 TaxID=3420564 RepID=UPI003D04680E
GMFYYYFKSKEDIFLACMETYFDEKLKNKLDIFQNVEIDYEERIKMLRDLVVKDINQFTRKYNFSSNNSITDNSYRLWELAHYIGKFIDVYSEFIIEGIEGGKIENNMGIDRENVKSFAAFILYGAVGTIYNDYIIKGENKTNSSEAFGIISELFQRPH